MPLRHIAAALLFAAILAGCTPYQSQGLTGGFTDTPLAANRYRVDVRGNGYTSEDRVKTIGLVRAAEVTYQNGFTRFVILSADSSDTRTAATILPGEYRENTTGVGVFSGNTLIYNGNTTGTYRPPTTIIVSKHRVSFDVLMLKPGDEGYEQGLDAAQVLAKYGPEVGRK
jgi:hypothetical protein